MDIKEASVLRRDHLYAGCILASVVHAIMVSCFPHVAHEHSWDDTNYSTQNSMGARGTITFAEHGCVGVFFDERSSRNPFNSPIVYDINLYFQGTPNHLRHLAEQEALQFVLQQYNGKVSPIITSAFWSENQNLAAAEPWQEVVANGAFLLELQLESKEYAITRWQADYEMSQQQIDLALSLLERKIIDSDEPIFLTSTEYQAIVDASTNVEAINESRSSFAEMNIVLP